MSGKYDDILHLPHPVSAKHPRMSMQERAAQFSPFAALTGHGEVIRETGRLTEDWLELDEAAKAELDRRLRLLAAGLDQRPTVTATWFQPDERKAGGAYVSATGTARKLDPLAGVLLLEDGTQIPVQRLVSLEGAFLRPPANPAPSTAE